MKLFKRKLKAKLEPEKIKDEVPIESADKDTFTDSRDGHIYKTVKIGNQIWMAENLAYKTSSGCWADANDESNVAELGYLYNWETALKVCPKGWRLPTKKDFENILEGLGDSYEAYEALIPGGGTGLSLLFGHWHDQDPNADTGGDYAFFWSSTSSEEDASCAWTLDIDGENDMTYLNHEFSKAEGISVRCIKD